MAEPDLATQQRILLEHYDAMLTHFGADAGLRLARKHVAWYSRGLPGSAEFRATVMRLTEAPLVVALIARFYAPLIAGGYARDFSAPPVAEAA
jgi:tRNA-dihydrouridine synthase B